MLTPGPFARLATWVLDHRRLVLAVLVALTAALGHQAATRLRFDATLEAFLATDAPVRVRLERFRATFGRDDVFVIVAVGDVFSAPYLERLATLRDAILAIDDPPDVVTGVDNLLDAPSVRAGGGAVSVRPLAELLPEISAFRDAARAAPTVRGNLLSDDGGATGLVVRTAVVPEKASHALYRRLMAITAAHAAPGFALHVAGGPALAAAINAHTLSDAYRSLAAALVLIGVLLGLIYRHPLAVLGPFAVIFVSLVWTFGAMALLGYPMTALHNILPTLLLTVGLGDAVHLMSVFRVEARADGDAFAATVRALDQTGRPIVFTSLTTALGMLGFTVTRLGVTSEFGAFAALGVTFAMVLSLTLLPIVLAGRLGAGIARAVERPGPIERLVDATVGFAVRRHRAVLVASALLAVVAGALTLRLEVRHDPLRFLPAGHPVRLAFDQADARLGGTVNLEVMLDSGADDGLNEPGLLRRWAALEAHLLAWRGEDGRGPGGHASLLDVVRETWHALGGEGDLPADRAGVAQTLLAYEMADGANLGRLMTRDGRIGRLSIRLPWLEAHQYRSLARWLEAGAAAHLRPPAQVWPTGGVYTLLSVVDALIGDMVRSFALALGLIGGAMMLLLRSVRLGLLAMIPNMLPIALVLAVMATCGVPVDMFNLLLASIALGVVVDDTVHFFHHVAVRRRQGRGIEEAIAGAARHAGRAMVVTSVLLCAGFGAFLSAHMVNLQLFGALLVLTIVAALGAELLVGPALLRAFAGGGLPRGQPDGRKDQPDRPKDQRDSRK